jgi:hypothetical protein
VLLPVGFDSFPRHALGQFIALIGIEYVLLVGRVQFPPESHGPVFPAIGAWLVPVDAIPRTANLRRSLEHRVFVPIDGAIAFGLRVDLTTMGVIRVQAPGVERIDDTLWHMASAIRID